MAQNNSMSKGNGASKRMSNPKLKAKRARCWENSQRRKVARNDRMIVARADNQHSREIGALTPWEKAKAARADRRRSLQRTAA